MEAMPKILLKGNTRGVHKATRSFLQVTSVAKKQVINLKNLCEHQRSGFCLLVVLMRARLKLTGGYLH